MSSNCSWSDKACSSLDCASDCLCSSADDTRVHLAAPLALKHVAKSDSGWAKLVMGAGACNQHLGPGGDAASSSSLLHQLHDDSQSGSSLSCLSFLSPAHIPPLDQSDAGKSATAAVLLLSCVTQRTPGANSPHTPSHLSCGPSLACQPVGCCSPPQPMEVSAGCLYFLHIYEPRFGLTLLSLPRVPVQTRTLSCHAVGFLGCDEMCTQRHDRKMDRMLRAGLEWLAGSNVSLVTPTRRDTCGQGVTSEGGKCVFVGGEWRN